MSLPDSVYWVCAQSSVPSMFSRWWGFYFLVLWSEANELNTACHTLILKKVGFWVFCKSYVFKYGPGVRLFLIDLTFSRPTSVNFCFVLFILGFSYWLVLICNTPYSPHVVVSLFAAWCKLLFPQFLSICQFSIRSESILNLILSVDHLFAPA